MNSSCWMVYQFDPHVSTGSAFRLCCSYLHFAPQKVPFASDFWDVHPGVVSGTYKPSIQLWLHIGTPPIHPAFHFPPHLTFRRGRQPENSAHDMQDWGQVEIRNSESLANGAIFPLPQNWNFDGMSRYIHYQQWVLLYIIWIIMVHCVPLFCTPEAVSAKTRKWQTQFCLEWQDCIFSGTHIDSDVFKKGLLENDTKLMN